MKEFSHKDYISISTPVNSRDFKLFQSIVNKGIDSHLEAFTKSQFFFDCGRFYFHFHKSEKSILLRRLNEYFGDVYNSASSDDEWLFIEAWIEDINEYDHLIKD